MTVVDFEMVKTQYLMDIKMITEMDGIPEQLIINWDQTSIEYVPVSSWTMAPRGSKRVDIIGKDDKRQITDVFACTLSGDFLPIQLIYKGKTNKCLPSVTFPLDWNVTFSDNHWSNEKTMVEYITQLLLPYIDRKKKELNINEQHWSLVIFDCFKGLLEESNVSLQQPINLNSNKAAKEHMQGIFQELYSHMVMKQFYKN
jgi:hypothetical protein